MNIKCFKNQFVLIFIVQYNFYLQNIISPTDRALHCVLAKKLKELLSWRAISHMLHDYKRTTSFIAKISQLSLILAFTKLANYFKNKVKHSYFNILYVLSNYSKNVNWRIHLEPLKLSEKKCLRETMKIIVQNKGFNCFFMKPEDAAVLFIMMVLNSYHGTSHMWGLYWKALKKLLVCQIKIIILGLKLSLKRKMLWA